jgi:hypothetical protein
MFFVSPDGELCRDDPRQLKLPKTGAAARVVSISKAEDKDDN